MQISDNQFYQIKKEIEGNSNLPDTMKNEMLDHICCTIEEYMEKGKTFDESFILAFDYILPNKGEDFHKETLYLLSAQKVSLMKRSVRINGFIVLVTAPMGILFKFNHFPAANLILFLGTLCLIFGFMPAFFINSYKSGVRKFLSSKVKYISGYLSISMLVVAGVLKLCHIPGANVILICGMFLLCFGFLPFMYFKSIKW